jgi:DNA-binding MarR family transcriptional regulator
MNYTPQTQWIGGSYPGVMPPHLHHYVDVEKRIRERKPRRTQFQPTPTIDLILTAIKTKGPISLIQLVEVTGRSGTTVYARVAALEKKWLITKELRKNEHNHQRSFFYSGVQ